MSTPTFGGQARYAKKLQVPILVVIDLSAVFW